MNRAYFYLGFFIIGCGSEAFTFSDLKEIDAGEIIDTYGPDIITSEISSVSDSGNTSENITDTNSYIDSTNDVIVSMDRVSEEVEPINDAGTCNPNSCPICPASGPYECCKQNGTCGCTWAPQAVCL